jgi:acetyl-CoA C-acetyltransferase
MRGQYPWNRLAKDEAMSEEILLAGGVRTPIGSFGGAISSVPAPILGATAIKAAIRRAAVPAEQIDEVIFGNVLGAGLGQNVARQAAIGAGLSPAVGATTVNKVCGSSLKAVMMAAQAIKAGDAEMIVAGGTENMSSAPYLLPKARNGYRMGNGEIVDSMIRDGLWDVYNNVHMGTCGDRCAEKYQFSRQQQDDFAVASFQRVIEAQQKGLFASEIVPVDVPSRQATVTVDRDEGPSRFNEEKLRSLQPAFGKTGTVTAGNASSINDGAAAVVVLSAKKAGQLGVKPQARILGYATFSREPEWFTLAPIGAIAKLMEQLKLKVTDVDLFEINEAFAVVPMAAMAELGIPHDKVNVHGGAVALGHPIGASGARVLVTLLDALRQRHGRIGIASLCIGGGEAVALAVQASD